MPRGRRFTGVSGLADFQRPLFRTQSLPFVYGRVNARPHENARRQTAMDHQREIERLAYFLWQNAGEPFGTAERDWVFAQHVIETGPVRAPDWSNHRRANEAETASKRAHVTRDSSS